MTTKTLTATDELALSFLSSSHRSSKPRMRWVTGLWGRVVTYRER